jgi:hypothetical protein
MGYYLPLKLVRLKKKKVAKKNGFLYTPILNSYTGF